MNLLCLNMCPLNNNYIHSFLQQNYIMGFIFNENKLCLTDEWYDDFNEVITTLSEDEAINKNDMQIDYRLDNFEG